ncbi:hypothetical protein O163_11405 [Caldanaerobacter subterraneus subsp. yonseiensis KB-1]|uniref:Uncharacterized protein n=1 Tax=Caldanaerobacter subterraneus subsp. yonseiensis KB-1 TaxID=1388761 RepID=U5CQK3_CALSX|nr:hypothetical protein O163_11405 [Caldanaerobacter subterraneus subsp. yonseiensis KB-1]
MEAVKLKKNKILRRLKTVPKRKIKNVRVKKVREFIPIIRYSELGIPTINSSWKTLREMYREEKWDIV